ncbi:hypothetical protein ACFVDH_22030 [Streptomyces sp. NPDC057674]
MAALVLAAAYTALVALAAAVLLGHANRIPRRRPRAHRPQERT